jgi:hypothetical protein
MHGLCTRDVKLYPHGRGALIISSSNPSGLLAHPKEAVATAVARPGRGASQPSEKPPLASTSLHLRTAPRTHPLPVPKPPLASTSPRRLVAPRRHRRPSPFPHPHHSPVASTGSPGDQAAQPNLKLPPRVAVVHDSPRLPRSARTACAAAGFLDVPHPRTRPRPRPLTDQHPHPHRARRRTSAPAPAPHTTPTTPGLHRRTHARALPHAAPARARTRAHPCRAPPPRLPACAASARARRHRPPPPCCPAPPPPPPRPSRPRTRRTRLLVPPACPRTSRRLAHAVTDQRPLSASSRR